jgi:ABC-type uncharacterized transport system substrate-binding protein
MSKRIPKKIGLGTAILFLAGFFALFGPVGSAAPAKNPEAAPRADLASKNDSPRIAPGAYGSNETPPTKPFRVAYVEAGPYSDYTMNLIGLAQGLADLGLIQNGWPPESTSNGNPVNAQRVWLWLSQNAGGDRLIFGSQDFYSADWNYNRLPQIKKRVLTRAAAGEIDLILAFGTAAGRLLATDDHKTPTLSITATDPVAAGVAKTAEKSGFDHVHVQVQTGRIERQLAIFHNVFGFKTLGIPYDPAGDDGGTMGVPTIRRVAERLGFKLNLCPAKLEIDDATVAFENLVGCLKGLSQNSEAVYLTVSNGMSEPRMPEILAPMMAQRRPTFSQRGPAETRLGVLMSLAEDDFLSSGQFEAEVIREILAGRSPGDVNQNYVAPLTMALNLKTAMAIGWDPPFKVLAAVDELYVGGSQPERPRAARPWD